MSYDIGLQINTGLELRDVVEIGNMTYNVGPMYAKAYGASLTTLDGKKCSDVLPALRKALAAMQDNPAEYRKLNPPNGWGDYGSALLYLEKLVKECAANPDCIIYVC